MPLPKLASLIEPDLVASGIWKNVDGQVAPYWVDGYNVNFRRGKVEKAKGWQELETAAATVNAVAQAFVGTEKRIYFGVSGGLYVYKAGVGISTIRSGLSAGNWSLVPWGNALFAANGVDALQRWPNTGTAADVSGAPGAPKIIRASNVHLVTLNNANGEGAINWCNAGDPTDWVVDPAKTTGGLIVRDISSGIRAAEPFQNGLGFYSDSSMYLLRYLGAGRQFGYTLLLNQVGAAGKNCVVADGPMHWGVEQRGFWRTDGAQVQFLADPAMWDYFASTIDWSKGDEIVGFSNTERGLVEWHWPTVTAGYAGAAFDKTRGIWTLRNYRVSAAQSGSVFPGPVGANDTKLVQFDTGVNAGSGALAAMIQSKPFDFGNADIWKFVDEIRTRATTSGTVNIEIGLQDKRDDAITWLTAETLAERHHPMRDTVLLSIRISSTGSNVDWDFAGMEIFGKTGGNRI